MTKDKVAHVALLYHGERFANGTTSVTAGGRELSPRASRGIVNHSAAFNWGYTGESQAQLALAILFDVTGDAVVAEQHYLSFRAQVVAQWDGDSWTISRAEVLEWLELGQTRCDG